MRRERKTKPIIKRNGIKDNKAITLVALVVTIIVLIILATVSISLLLGDHGLLKMAREARDNYAVAANEEMAGFIDIEDTMENLIKYSDEEDKTENSPAVPTGKMKVEYVTWAESNETAGMYLETATETKPDGWYNYQEGKWANIKTTSFNANENSTKNIAYWVWIPRYAYQVPVRPTSSNNSENPEFNIAFLKGNTYEAINEEDLKGGTIKTKAETSSGVSIGDWVVHPAFQYGNEELTGIWVAKFEASNELQASTSGQADSTELCVNVVPNASSWRYIKVPNMFTVCQNMTGEKGALENNTTADPHMMKNVEWGAVAYLTHSKYGRMRDGVSGKVWKNPNKNYITGQAGSGTSANANMSYQDSTDNYNVGNGPNASTTGNVYGIYDISGGTSEVVAAFVETTSTSQLGNLANMPSNPAQSKYVELYERDSGNSQLKSYDLIFKNNKITHWGDAMYETSYSGQQSTSWQSAYSYMPYSSSPLFIRGIDQGNTYAGVFAFYQSGGSDGNTGFRPVFIAK